MKHESIKKIKIRIFWISLTLIIIVSSLFTIQEMMVIRRIANEFHMEYRITPSRDALLLYLFFKEIKPSMTRQEIHNVLDRIGIWEIRWHDEPNVDQGVWDPETQQFLFREKIRFSNYQISRILKSWMFFYNEDGVLINHEIIDIGG